MNLELLKEFRGKFSSQHIDPPSSHFPNFDQRDVTRLMEDDQYASSFLSWKKNNIEDSLKLAVDALQWRKKNNVNDLSMQGIGEEFYARKGLFIRGKCKDGNRLVYFIGKYYTKDDEAKTKKMYIYLLEKLRRDDPGRKVTLILDAGDCGMSNVDMGVIRLLVDCFMCYFPDMLGQTFIVDLPVILSAIWNMVKVWFDEELRERTHLCARKDLGKHITPEQTVAILGGTDAWEPSECDRDIATELSRDDDGFADAVENLRINEN